MSKQTRLLIFLGVAVIAACAEKGTNVYRTQSELILGYTYSLHAGKSDDSR